MRTLIFCREVVVVTIPVVQNDDGNFAARSHAIYRPENGQTRIPMISVLFSDLPAHNIATHLTISEGLSMIASRLTSEELCWSLDTAGWVKKLGHNFSSWVKVILAEIVSSENS
jgi:hypothetical protein